MDFLKEYNSWDAKRRYEALAIALQWNIDSGGANIKTLEQVQQLIALSHDAYVAYAAFLLQLVSEDTNATQDNSANS